MGRLNVFLKEKLLDELSKEAKEEGTNRTAIIQTALEEYLKAKPTNAKKKTSARRCRRRSVTWTRWRRSWANGMLKQ